MEESSFLRNANRHMLVCIETGFRLQPSNDQLSRSNSGDFMIGLVAKYNSTQPQPIFTWSRDGAPDESRWVISKLGPKSGREDPCQSAQILLG